MASIKSLQNAFLIYFSPRMTSFRPRAWKPVYKHIAIGQLLGSKAFAITPLTLNLRKPVASLSVCLSGFILICAK
jgi:hypothetical protein